MRRRKPIPESDIATPQEVATWLKPRHKFNAVRTEVDGINVVCTICGKGFHVKPSRIGKASYCSRACKGVGSRSKVELRCTTCGKLFLRHTSTARKAETPFCSRSCTFKHQKAERHPGWGGGRTTDNGYWMVRKDDGAYVYEHRLVMERHIGRPLTDGEVVHHKNRNKKDNRLENLMLMTNAEHVRLHAEEDCAAMGWSKEWSACIDCGTIKRPHKARGMCRNCYARNFKYAKTKA